MQIKEIKKEGLEREFFSIFSNQDFEKACSAKAMEIAKTAKIDGFRPGKVPVEFIAKRYRGDVENQAAETLIKQSIKEIVTTNGFKLATEPFVDFEKMQDGSGIQIKLTFELYPEIPEFKAEEVTLNKYVYKLTNQVDIELENLSNLAVEYKEAKDGAKISDGDKVNINFTGFVDGNQIEGGTAQNYDLIIGSKSFIEGFETGLIGKKMGDSVTLDLKFPEQYHSNDIAGKDVKFEVVINKISNSQKITDKNEIAKKFGVEEYSVFEELVRQRITKSHDEVVQSLMKKQLFDFIDSNINFDLPRSLLDAEKESLNRLSYSPDEDKLSEEQIEALSSRRVKLGILLSDVAKKLDIRITHSELFEALKNKVSTMPQHQAEAVVDYYLKNPEAMKGLNGEVIEAKVVDFLLNNVKISEIEVDSEELFKIAKNMDSQFQLVKKTSKTKK